MKWNRHYDYEGKHSFLSASQCHWINYTPEKVVSRFENELAKQRGTELHEFASEAINKRIRLLPGHTHPALANFVNDAIGFNMDSEVLLFYSPNAFGTADAIRYDPPKKDNPRGFLRIHDLKTGVTKPKMEQLLVYAAYFCLEYSVKPEKTDMILRIYQGDNIDEVIPEPEDVYDIMHSIKEFSALLENKP